MVLNKNPLRNGTKSISRSPSSPAVAVYVLPPNPSPWFPPAVLLEIYPRVGTALGLILISPPPPPPPVPPSPSVFPPLPPFAEIVRPVSVKL